MLRCALRAGSCPPDPSQEPRAAALGVQEAQSFGFSRLSPETRVPCCLFRGQWDHRIFVSSFLPGQFGDGWLGAQVAFCVFYQLALSIVGLRHLSPVLIRKCEVWQNLKSVGFVTSLFILFPDHWRVAFSYIAQDTSTAPCETLLWNQ